MGEAHYRLKLENISSVLQGTYFYKIIKEQFHVSIKSLQSSCQHICASSTPALFLEALSTLENAICYYADRVYLGCVWGEGVE